MSFRIVDQIITEGLFDSTDKLVLLSLAKHADDENRTAWPSVDTITFQTGFSPRTVQRSLRRLERLRIITDVTQYFDDPKGERQRATKYGGNHNTTHYRIADVRSKEIKRVLLAEWNANFESRKKKTIAKKPRQADALKPRHADVVNRAPG